MKKILKVLILSMILLTCSLSLASYITKETDFKYETGIKVTKDNQIIENQVFYEIPVGIAVWSSNNRIANCTFINCDDEGIVFFGGTPLGSDNNTIINCVFYNCCDGVELQKSSNNIFINCRFLSCSHAGIDGIMTSNDNNSFISCVFYDNPMGCYFSDSKDNEFINCTFLDNKIDMEERK